MHDSASPSLRATRTRTRLLPPPPPPQDNVEEVSIGVECGVGVEGFTEWNEGDVLECFLRVTKSRRLEDAHATMAVDMSSIAQ